MRAASCPLAVGDERISILSGSRIVVATRCPCSSAASVMIQIFWPLLVTYADKMREPSCKASSFSWRSPPDSSPQSPWAWRSRNWFGDCPASWSTARAPGVARTLPIENFGLIVSVMLIFPKRSCGFDTLTSPGSVDSTGTACVNFAAGSADRWTATREIQPSVALHGAARGLLRSACSPRGRPDPTKPFVSSRVSPVGETISSMIFVTRHLPPGWSA